MHKSLRKGYDQGGSGKADSEDSDDSNSDSDDGGAEDEQAHKLAMEMMLNGEHPDNEIDKLLQSFGVQMNQIGLMPTI